MPDQHQLVASGLGTSLSRIVTAYTVLRGWEILRILPGIVAVRERPDIQRLALSRFGELQGGTAEGRMSAGLRRVPSFSGGRDSQWAAGIAYLLSTHQDAAIEAHFLSNKFTWGLFELLQVLVVDADDQSSSCLQQKLEELSYEGSPQPASLCRSGAMAVSCEQDFNRLVLGAAVRCRELSGVLSGRR